MAINRFTALKAWLVAGLLTSSLAQASELQPCSQAEVKALGFIRVATVSLWQSDCSQAKLTPPLQLRFDYVRSVPGDAMAKAAMFMVERNIEPAQFDVLANRLQAFNNEYQDTRKGDRYELVYNNDGTVEMRLNGETLAREQGHEFARAYLQIWFGPKPYSDSMKQTLLGEAG